MSDVAIADPVSSATSVAGKRKLRAVVVAGAVTAGLVILAAARVAGIDVQTPSVGSGSGPTELGPLQVVLAAVIAGLAAWGLLALLERITPRARVFWTAIAALVLVASFGTPLSGGISTASRVVLELMHVTVGAILIVGMRHSASRRATR